MQLGFGISSNRPCSTLAGTLKIRIPIPGQHKAARGLGRAAPEMDMNSKRIRLAQNPPRTHAPRTSPEGPEEGLGLRKQVSVTKFSPRR